MMKKNLKNKKKMKKKLKKRDCIQLRDNKRGKLKWEKIV